MPKNVKPAQKSDNKSNDPALEARLETRLEEILEQLYGFYKSEIELSLERVERFLHQLGDPHLKLPPVIHVAGTNGKGSTIAILRSLLEASGKSVHVMTSPHLLHQAERIRLAGELISTKALVEVLEECLVVNQSEPITSFELFTAATYLAMSRSPADYALLETGMGGRFDATNVIPKPLLTIITTISKDHEKFLGNTLKEIAFEKAGIIKAGVPCVIGYQTDEAIDAGVPEVFHDVSKALSPEAKLFQCGENWFIKANHDRMQFSIQYRGQSELIVTARPNLLGPHQIYNAGAALAAYRIIMAQNFEPQILSPDHPQNPLLTIYWPGRLQRLENEPLCRSLKHGQELWIDGGHNDSAGAALAEQAKVWQEQDGKPLHLIVAMVNRKDPKAFLTPLLPYTKSLTVTDIKGESSSISADELYDIVKPLGFKNLSKENTAEKAMTKITEKDDNARILIIGSLYFLGHLLSRI